MLSQLEKKLFSGKPILPIGAAAFLFMFVVLSSQFGCTIGLVSGIATIASIVLSMFSFTNCYGYGFKLIFFLTLSALTYLKYHKFFEVLDIFARNGINKHICCYEVHQMNFGVILGVRNSNSRQDFRR